MKKVALFGTSADPPTAGHQKILKWLSEHYDHVAVWTSDNPFKNHQSPLEDRLKMLRLLMSDLNLPDHNIEVYEELSHRRSLFSVQKAKQIWGENALYSLVIGSDLIGQIRHWYHAEELLQQVTLLIIPRPGYLIKDEDLQALDKMGARYKIATLELPAISSSTYRETKDKNLITHLVKDYIHQKKLYS